MRKRNLIVLILGIVIVAGLALLVRSTPHTTNSSTPGTERVETDPAPTEAAVQATESIPALDVCERPYTDDSIWNIPIDWTQAKVHPDNDAMLAAFFHSEAWVGSDASQFAPNIYLVTNETPVVEVKLRKNSFRDAITDLSVRFGEPGGTIWMPIPEGAVPAPGTDGQMVVVNLETGEEWGLNKGEIDANGNWTAGGAYRYDITNSGIPPRGFAQRGGGIGQLAGIVRRCEVIQGAIHHAVTLAYDYPCEPEICAVNGWPASIPPFTKTDGRGVAAYDIPEGARIAIRPDISMEQIRSVCNQVRGCVVWARAMQKYGGFVVDNSGHPKTYAEGNATAQWEPSIWTDNMLRDIPPDWYVVIDWNFPSTKAGQ